MQIKEEIKRVCDKVCERSTRGCRQVSKIRPNITSHIKSITKYNWNMFEFSPTENNQAATLEPFFRNECWPRTCLSQASRRRQSREKERETMTGLGLGNTFRWRKRESLGYRHLAIWAKMSLRRFWAKQIPRIWSKMRKIVKIHFQKLKISTKAGCQTKATQTGGQRQKEYPLYI